MGITAFATNIISNFKIDIANLSAVHVTYATLNANQNVSSCMANI
jgi:hypothetical protein